MNIVQACDYVAPAKDSQGAERIVERLSKGLVSSGHRVSMLLNAKTQASPVNGATLVSELPSDTDVVHFHGWDPVEYAKCGFPWITTVHGYSLHQLPDLAIGNKRCIAVSKFAAKQFRAINYVWNFACSEEFGFVEKKQDYFLWLAGTDWAENKGLLSSIELSQRLGFKLKIAGTGRNQEIIKYLQNLNNPKIEYVGAVNGPAKVKIIQNAKALILLSRVPDACPVTVSEAMMCGTPVIGSDNGSLPEIILDGTTGFVCKNSAQAMRAILNIDRIRPRLCRQFAEKHFSIEKGAASYALIYQQAIKDYAISKEHQVHFS